MARLITSKAILCALILSVVNISYASESYRAKVVSVIDGDTIKVLRHKKMIKIRLANIDCPEKSQPWGQNAKKALSERIFGHKIKIQASSKDRYGRTIAEIFYKKDNLNQEMVAKGHCWEYTKYSKDPTLLDMQKAAKEKSFGLWSLQADQRIEPWVWRKMKK
jgi:endonuclease YncB( thermonuclease family)